MKDLPKYDYLYHLQELKKRLIVIFLVFLFFFGLFYYYSHYLYDVLLYPLKAIHSTQNKHISFIYTALPEAFITQIKMSLFASLMVTLPIAFLQIYKFVSPALYKKEIKFFKLIAILSPTLFYLGAFVAYFFAIPAAYKFFIGFEVIQNNNYLIEMTPKISEYLSLSSSIIMAFAICFQFPIILFILLTLDIITIDALKKFRKYMIVIVFILAAILTPPDPISQVILALQLIFLYEGSIILFKITQPKSR